MKLQAKFFITMLLVISPSLSFATLKGVLDAIYKEGNDWKVAGWACQVGTSNNPIVKFYTGPSYTTLLGSVIVNETSEPEINASGVCNNSDTTLRFEYTLPSIHLRTIYNYPVKAVATYFGETNTELTQSKDIALPIGYAADPFSDLLTASKVIWFGAHPDDESYVAAFFGDMCFNSITCKLAVTTNSGDTTRGPEMSEAATTLEQWETDYGDDPVEWVIDELDTFQPDYILTFDPRFGSSCHPAHKAVAVMVKDAVDTHSSYSRSDVFIVNQLLRYESGPTPHPEIAQWIHPSAFDPAYKRNKAYAYSGDFITDETADNGPTGWDWVLDIAEIHDSQVSTVEFQRIKPLHVYSGDWVGTDVTGRLMSLQRLSDYSATQAPYNNYSIYCP